MKLFIVAAVIVAFKVTSAFSGDGGWQQAAPNYWTKPLPDKQECRILHDVSGVWLFGVVAVGKSTASPLIVRSHDGSLIWYGTYQDWAEFTELCGEPPTAIPREVREFKVLVFNEYGRGPQADSGLRLFLV